jgi:1-acyl-sn-glycerol-3-phosphate acyltransferase
MSKKIQDWSLGYAITKAYASFVFHRYYREVKVLGLENIPTDSPYLLAPNHQNALMDALDIACIIKQQPVFMARADIFKKTLIIRILTAMKIMPVYRIRDGYSNLGKNDEAFEKALDVMRDYKPMCMMPEGNHGDQHKLRPLVKGIFRVAFSAHEQLCEKKGVKIIPVGLHLSHYSNFKSDLIIEYGKPIEVAEYFDLYKENPAIANNALRDRLAAELKKYMIHIETSDYYDSAYAITELYGMKQLRDVKPGKPSAYKLFKSMQQVADGINNWTVEQYQNINGKVKDYTSGLKKLQLRDWVFTKPKYSWLLLVLESVLMVLLSPLYIYGLVLNYIPYKLPVKATKNIKDVQFHSSVKFVLAMLLFPIYYLILFLIAFFIIEPAWISLLYLVSLPLSGEFAFWYYIRLKKIRAMFKYNVLLGKNDSDLQNVIQLRQQIFEYVKDNLKSK